MRVWIEGIGVFGPGLIGWEATRPVLRGDQPYSPADLPKLAPPALPADVRRRTTEHIKLAVELGSQAVTAAGANGSALWSVFASSESDGAITHNICEEVAKAAPEVSPTRFHNSVNNASAGYWCMAIKSQAPSTSVAGFDATFAVGLIEACAQVEFEHQSVLLVVHDTPLPEPLHSVQPISTVFGLSFVLSPTRSARSLAGISVNIDPVLLAPSRLDGAALEGLRTGNPAARGLPLLASVARQIPETLVVSYVHGQSLRIAVEPI